MNRVIEVTTDLNIENTKLVLDGLAKCRGIENYHVYIHVDDGCHGMLDMLRNHSLRHVRLLKAFRIGRDCSVYAAMEHGFQCADYVIHLDDTAVPHPQFLYLHECCQEDYRDNLNIVAVSASGELPSSSPLIDSDWTFHEWSTFHPIAWGTWKNRWKKFFQQNWYELDGCDMDRHSWLEGISGRMMNGRKQISPHVSYCDLIPSKVAVAA